MKIYSDSDEFPETYKFNGKVSSSQKIKKYPKIKKNDPHDGHKNNKKCPKISFAYPQVVHESLSGNKLLIRKSQINR